MAGGHTDASLAFCLTAWVLCSVASVQMAVHFQEGTRMPFPRQADEGGAGVGQTDICGLLRGNPSEI